MPGCLPTPAKIGSGATDKRPISGGAPGTILRPLGKVTARTTAQTQLSSCNVSIGLYTYSESESGTRRPCSRPESKHVRRGPIRCHHPPELQLNGGSRTRVHSSSVHACTTDDARQCPQGFTEAANRSQRIQSTSRTARLPQPQARKVEMPPLVGSYPWVRRDPFPAPGCRPSRPLAGPLFVSTPSYASRAAPFIVFHAAREGDSARRGGAFPVRELRPSNALFAVSVMQPYMQERCSISWDRSILPTRAC